MRALSWRNFKWFLLLHVFVLNTSMAKLAAIAQTCYNLFCWIKHIACLSVRGGLINKSRSGAWRTQIAKKHFLEQWPRSRVPCGVTRAWFNIKMIILSHNWISYTGKIFLYWIEVHVIMITGTLAFLCSIHTCHCYPEYFRESQQWGSRKYLG